MKIVLVAVNAQYYHTNLAVRSIAAYMRAQGTEAQIAEFTINQRPAVLLEELAKINADAYLFSCYIWNIDIVTRLAADLKQILPGAYLAAGGPQVSYHSADFLRANPAFNAVLRGEGEQTTLALCKALAGGETPQTLPGLVIAGGKEAETPMPPPLDMDSLPFAYADLQEVQDRILYYESTRGCPFECSYCLSSVERGVRYKSLPKVCEELGLFLAAGVRQVKFVDRTFNCNKAHAMGIWRYLAQHDNGVTNFHFELAGELLDEEMLAFLGQVRSGLFQFEVGVQSTNVETLQAIHRPAVVQQVLGAARRILAGGNIHLHLDLIAGLPFEGIESFAQSFDTVYALRPHQFQLGMLKILPGSGLEAQAAEFGIVYSAAPPFEVLATRWLSYHEICLLGHIADMVELFYNSGRFSHLIEHIASFFSSPFVFYKKLALFYLAGGHDLAPLSKTGQYQLLGSFMQAEGIDADEKAQWLCRYDLALHEKIKALPQWVTVDGATPHRERALRFYRDENNLAATLPQYMGREAKQILKMAHIEVFPFDLATGAAGECAILFDYTRRDVGGAAKQMRVQLPQ